MATPACRQKPILDGIARAKALIKDRNRLLVAIGWQLSPFTEYNDPLVNIPLAGVMAGLFRVLFGWSLKRTFIPCYWFTNVLGILLLAWGLRRSGRALVAGRAEVARLVLVTAAFSLLLFLVGKLL